LIAETVTEKNKEEWLVKASETSYSDLRLEISPSKPQEQDLLYKFAVAYRYMYASLQNILEERPDLRPDVLSVGSELEDLKGKLNG